MICRWHIFPISFTRSSWKVCMIIDKSSSGISAMIFVNSIAMFISPRVNEWTKTLNVKLYDWTLSLNPLSASFTKWSSTLKQFVDKLPTNCLGVFDNFVGLTLKGLMGILLYHLRTTNVFFHWFIVTDEIIISLTLPRTTKTWFGWIYRATRYFIWKFTFMVFDGNICLF